MMAFVVFVGFGTGSIAFSLVMAFGLTRAFLVFGGFGLLLAVEAIAFFKNKRPRILHNAP